MNYLNRVKNEFIHQPQVFVETLDLVKKLYNLQNIPNIITRISELFKGRPKLISGFNQFLPDCYKIELVFCKICAKEYCRLNSLLEHVKTVHEIEKTEIFKCNKKFNCEVCHKQYTRIIDLKKHFERFHEKSAKYKCEICQKPYIHRAYLKRHERLHSDEYLLNCEICQRRFMRQYDFERHMKKHVIMGRLLRDTLRNKDLNMLAF